MSLQLYMWSIFSRAVFSIFSIIKFKKLAVICAELWGYFNAKNLLSHVGGVPYFYPSKPIWALLVLSRQHWPHFSSCVLFWCSIICGCHLFPRMRDGWGIRMVVCGQAKRWTGLGPTAQALPLPVKAIVLNLYGLDFRKVTKSEVSKQCERDCDC